MRALNLKGKQIGRLLVLERVENDIYGKSLWKCKCDCGNVKNIRRCYLNGKSISSVPSCGCLAREMSSQRSRGNTYSRKEKGIAGLNTVLQKYKYTAKKNNRKFELTKEEFRKITSSECFYCGTPPLKIQYSYFTGGWKASKDAIENSGYPYNGIDRMDSNKGYEKGNCVPCCYICNYAKRDMDMNEFIEWIEKVSNNIKINSSVP